MRKTVLTLFVMFSAYIINAQYVNSFNGFSDQDFKVVDTAQMQISYRFQYYNSMLKKADSLPDLLTDHQVLLIGRHSSKYFSQYLLDQNRSKVKKESYDTNRRKAACYFEIYKNYPRKGIMSYIDLNDQYAFGGFYRYKETMPQFHWTLSKDTVSILGQLCYKAQTSYRGRNYTAWYNPKIKLSTGPWKFGGLPGLIMKISDSDNLFQFECTGINKLRKAQPIKYYNLSYKDMTLEKLDLYYKRFFKNMIPFLASVNSELASQLNKANLLPVKYVPIELIQQPETNFALPAFQTKNAKSVKIAGLNIYDSINRNEKEIIPALLKKHKGKTLMIDFWSVYCPPCIQGMKEMKPHLKELDKNIAIVYLSTASAPKKEWLQKVNELGGEHYYIPEYEWYCINSEYNIHALPSYLIFDKSGKLRQQITGFPGVEKLKEALKD